jgi:hypothetical protein
MTVERDVCEELDNLNSVQIFQGYIFKYNRVYPRAVEIFLGIFNNMITLLGESISLKLLISQQQQENTNLIQFILFDCFSLMLDVQVVTQCVQLFSLLLTTSKLKFIDLLKNDSNWSKIVEKFYFILEQSLNSILIDSTVMFLFNLIDSDDLELNSLTLNVRLVEVICIACNTRMNIENNKSQNNQLFTSKTTTTTNVNQTPSIQLNESTNNEICYIDNLVNKYFLCIHSMSTNEQGCSALYAKFELILNLFNEYLSKCCMTFMDWEIRSSDSLRSIVNEESLENLNCLLSVLNSQDLEYSSFAINDDDDFLLKLFTMSQSYLKLLNEFKQQQQQQQQDNLYETSFNLVKSNLNELITNINNFITTNNQQLKSLISNCQQLLLLLC